ncbi:MAG: arginine--tRNA ligase [Patescibacteria group bacterium]
MDNELMIRDQIKEDLEKALKSLQIEQGKVEVSRTTDSRNGDYTSNVSLKIAGKLKPFDVSQDKQSPMEVAKKITDSIGILPHIEKLEVKEPGFINFFVKNDFWQDEVEKVLKEEVLSLGGPKLKIIVEFTDPNPFKEFHIGHLYSNIVGESISRLLEATGAVVKRANYQGDIGMHVAKTIWGIPKLLDQIGEKFEDIEKKDLGARVFFLGQAYSLGAKEFEASQGVKAEIAEINKKIFAKDPSVLAIYEKGKKWSLDYFEQIYERLGTKFDFYYLESEVGEVGAKIVREFLEKGVFIKSEGAIVFPGEKYGLHSRVFINSLGLPTYEAKELGLAPTKYKDFAYDESVIVTGNEINDYFKVLLAALAQVAPELAVKTRHISHGMVRMPGGKMSSRLGNVLLGEWLLDEAKKRVIEAFEEVPAEVAEQIGVGAIKYALLKGNIGQDVNFTFEEAISLSGNSGPYLQYAYARCRSVLAKSNKQHAKSNKFDLENLEPEESALLRTLGHFEEVVLDAAESFAPSALANFLYEAAQKYNSLYNNLPILKAGEKERGRRLFLTRATADVLKKGLSLLGIAAPEKM